VVTPQSQTAWHLFLALTPLVLDLGQGHCPLCTSIFLSAKWADDSSCLRSPGEVEIKHVKSKYSEKKKKKKE
jgi:hypothetical protein